MASLRAIAGQAEACHTTTAQTKVRVTCGRSSRRPPYSRGRRNPSSRASPFQATAIRIPIATASAGRWISTFPGPAASFRSSWSRRPTTARSRAAIGPAPPNTPPNPLFTDANYAFVVTDWRGRHESDGRAEKAARRSGERRLRYGVLDHQNSPGATAASAPGDPRRSATCNTSPPRAHPPGLIFAVPMAMPFNLDYETYFPGGVMWDEFPGMLHAWASSPICADCWRSTRSRMRIGPNSRPRVKSSRPICRFPCSSSASWYDIYTDVCD